MPIVTVAIMRRGFLRVLVGWPRVVRDRDSSARSLETDRW